MKIQSDNTYKVPGHCEGSINDSEYHLYFKFIVPSLGPRAFKESELFRLQKGAYAVYYVMPLVGLGQQVIIENINTSAVAQKQDQSCGLTNGTSWYRSGLAKMIRAGQVSISNKKFSVFRIFQTCKEEIVDLYFHFRDQNLLLFLLSSKKKQWKQTSSFPKA